MLTNTIVYSKAEAGGSKPSDIYTLDTNNNETQMTDGATASPARDSAGADWSPDGLWLVFDSTRDNHPSSDIYKLEVADASNIRRLTQVGGTAEDASWSKHNNLIIYASDGDGTADYGPWTMDAAGLNETTLNLGSNQHLFPRWSPDSTKYAVAEEYTRPENRIVWLDYPSTTKNQVTSGHWDSAPSFAPAATDRIVFSRQVITGGLPENRRDLYTIKLDGTGVEKITNASANEHYDDPCWSADGVSIVFSKKGTTGGYQIHEMNYSTKAITQITNAPDDDHRGPIYKP